MKFEDLKVTVYADGADIEAMKEEYKNQLFQLLVHFYAQLSLEL